MDPQASQRIGNGLRSTLLLQDINMIEALAHFTHERIPERYATSTLYLKLIQSTKVKTELFMPKALVHTENSK